MAGGALYNNLDYSFTVGHEDGGFQPSAETPGGGSAALRGQLRHLRAFFDEIPFWRMQPAAEDLARGAEGVSVRALAEAGKVYAIYMHQGRSVKGAKPPYQVDATPGERPLTIQLPAASYSAEWRDTKKGSVVQSSTVTATGEKATQLTSPVYAEDIALVIRAVAANKR
jgi:hypothetical protein